MKVFIAGFDTETNTFSPIPTGYQSFAERFLAHGDATRQPINYCSNQLLIWRRGERWYNWRPGEPAVFAADAWATLSSQLGGKLPGRKR